MLPKNKSGNILIPLLILLALSFGVLLAAKFFSTSQANVETAIDSRYQLSPSAHMDPPSEWIKEENKKYNFSFYYPKQWVASQAPQPTGNQLFVIEKSLSRKISLTISVVRELEITSSTKEAKFDNNTYYLLSDTGMEKSAAMKVQDMYYIVKLTQNNYFAQELEFKGTYFQLLKKFQVTD